VSRRIHRRGPTPLQLALLELYAVLDRARRAVAHLSATTFEEQQRLIAELASRDLLWQIADAIERLLHELDAGELEAHELTVREDPCGCIRLECEHGHTVKQILAALPGEARPEDLLCDRHRAHLEEQRP
jgi:hypothetical protein